jgi:hypothetical protein
LKRVQWVNPKWKNNSISIVCFHISTLEEKSIEKGSKQKTIVCDDLYKCKIK